MSQPVQNLRHVRQFGPLRKGRPVDHQHRYAHRARGIQLGACTGTARVLGHNQFNAMLQHQRPVPCFGERSARHDRLAIGQRQCIRFIHQPQQEVMLGLSREIFKMQAANGQKNTPLRTSQSGNCRVNVRNVLPTISVLRAPCRTGQSGHGHPGLATRGNGVGTHLRGKGMGGIDYMSDRVVRQVTGQAVDAAEPSNTHWQGLRPWIVYPTGIGIGCRDALIGQGFGQCIGLDRATKDQEVGHA